MCEKRCLCVWKFPRPHVLMLGACEAPRGSGVLSCFLRRQTRSAPPEAALVHLRATVRLPHRCLQSTSPVPARGAPQAWSCLHVTRLHTRGRTFPTKRAPAWTTSRSQEESKAPAIVDPGAQGGPYWTPLSGQGTHAGQFHPRDTEDKASCSGVAPENPRSACPLGLNTPVAHTREKEYVTRDTLGSCPLAPAAALDRPHWLRGEAWACGESGRSRLCPGPVLLTSC